MRTLIITYIALFCSTVSIANGADELSREELNFFETKIRPVLVRE
ncbi:hypothetical protein OAH18_02795 [bacterium]|nr:hypothetical protein [bacterium]